MRRLWYISVLSGMVLLLGLSCDRERTNPLDPQSELGRELVATPTGLSAEPGIGFIRLGWQSVDSRRLAGYALFRSEQSTGQYRLVRGEGDTTLQITTGKLSLVDSLDAPGKTFFYRIAAVDTAGVLSLLSPFVGATVLEDHSPPGAPQNVWVVADQARPGRLTVNWSAPARDADGGMLTGLAGYVILRAEAGRSLAPVDTVDAQTFQYVDEGLEVAAVYSYTVLAFDRTGNAGPLGAGSQARTAGIAVPGGLVVEGGIGKVTVRWEASVEEDLRGYNVYRSLRPDQGYARLSGSERLSFTTGQTTYIDTAVAGGTAYYYQVSAVTSSGESGRSEFGGATVLFDIRPPAAPTLLTGEPVVSDPEKLSVSWKAPTTDINGADLSGVSRYQIYRATASTGPFALVGTSTSAAFIDTGLTAKTTYYYEIEAQDASGNIGPLSSVVALISGGVDIPKNVRLSSSSPSDLTKPPVVTISWDAAIGAIVLYEVQHSTVANSTRDADYVSVLPNDVSTSRQDDEVSRGVTYYYRVRSVDVEDRVSDWTDPRTIAVSP
ncbi:MAG: hypothetical protein HYW07_04120 [Candidatus Latescibacteria bacterium]|nr:hypothetical protein [Candidatus Latescibacterota bacterium]